MTILVTGSTGTVGREVVLQLVDRGEVVRRAVTPSAATGDSDVASGSGELVLFDFTDRATYAAALDGVDRVFLMRPPPMSDVKREMRPFVEAMAQRPIRLVVFLSLMGVNPAMPHWRIERDLRAAHLPAVMLRPAFFTQNLATAYRDDIAHHDCVRLPAGRGRTSFVDTRDVAEVAVTALADPAAHAGRAYTLTGERAWTYDEVASMLSAELGRAIRYQRVGFLRYRADLKGQGLPVDYVRVQLLINAIARLGLAAKTTTTISDVLGREPTELPQTIHRLREAWLPASKSDS